MMLVILLNKVRAEKTIINTSKNVNMLIASALII